MQFSIKSGFNQYYFENLPPSNADTKQVGRCRLRS